MIIGELERKIHDMHRTADSLNDTTKLIIDSLKIEGNKRKALTYLKQVILHTATLKDQIALLEKHIQEFYRKMNK